MSEGANHHPSSVDFPPALYIATYDICGYDQAAGREKETRKTGLVTHTNQLVDGFSQINPHTQITVSQTGSPEDRPYYLTTPEGQTVLLTSIHAKPLALKDPVTLQASPERITFHYETDIHNPDNPIYRSLAEQYAATVHQANTPYVLLQNPNPLVGILKAEEFGLIDADRCRRLCVTNVLHDTGSYPRRFEYISDRLAKTRMDIAFISISGSVHGYLRESGVPEELITLVPSGINIERFDERLKKAKKLGVFACVRARNGLPVGKELVLCTAPRVKLKGYEEIVKAARIMKDRGGLDNAYMAFAGKNMFDAKSVNHTEEVGELIRTNDLSGDVFLLDSVSPDELAACYGEARTALLASTHPEGLPYVNFEAMLAGVPIITTRLGGPLDYVKHGQNGLFVRPRDPFDLATAIELILSSPGLHAKIVQNGRKTAEEYSLERMIRGYARVITRTHKNT